MAPATLRIVALTLLAACLAGRAEARDEVAAATRVAELQAFADTLKQRARAHRLEAQRRAARAGLPLRRDLPGGGAMELQRFEPGQAPRFYITNNAGAADSTSTDELWPGGGLGLSLEGTSMLVGEWDGGAVYVDHPDLLGRAVQADGATEPSNHATHVAGTLVGSGGWLVPQARGMAYDADLEIYDWNDDAAEMAAAAAGGLLLSNHSYGIAAGWLYLGGAPPDTWWWIGGADPADVEDPYFGYYDSVAADWDTIARNAPYYLIVKAAGNDGLDVGPAPGEEYTVIDQDGDPLFVSDLPRNPDCTPLGYDCLPTQSGATNILTVSSVEDVPGGYNPVTGAAAVRLSGFSSRGPTDDGRIKPDLVGNGDLLISTWGDNPFYAVAAGTSMAAPNVTGSLLLLQEHYDNLNGSYLRAATLKALAIHTADEAGDHPGPDYWFGWGLFNAMTAAELISDAGSGPQIIEDSLSDAATDTHFFIASDADADLVATLVWADPAGTPVPLALDAPDLMLVNDLDLRVTKDATTYLPWILDPANPADAATRGDNVRDNVEQVVVEAGGTGIYFIEVSHKGALDGGADQPYSLIVSERPAAVGDLVTVLSEDFEGGLPAGWNISNEGGVSWEIRTPIAADPRYDNFTNGSGKFAMVDVEPVVETYTGLESPSVDLTDATVVTLKFESYFVFDTAETINVETSTDGGASWDEVWSYQGFNPFPTNYAVDLSTTLAGAADARFRFWFDSEGELYGNLWQVDDVLLEANLPVDPEPPTPDATCSGDAVDVQGLTFIGPASCTATVSLAMHNQVRLQDSAVVTISSPAVTLGGDFSVELGSTLSVSVD